MLALARLVAGGGVKLFLGLLSRIAGLLALLERKSWRIHLWGLELASSRVSWRETEKTLLLCFWIRSHGMGLDYGSYCDILD
jgi:hypothetical protein